MIRIGNIRRMGKEGGARCFLVDRQWPKDVVRAIPHKEKSGQGRAALALIDWVPQLAPSAALWKWFQHDPGKTDQFRSRYFQELLRNKKRWVPIAQESLKGDVVLLFHEKRGGLTPAHYLKEFLDRQLEDRQVPPRAREKFVGRPGQGVAVPVDKSISRRRSQPLREEMKFAPKQKLTFVPAEKRRVLR